MPAITSRSKWMKLPVASFVGCIICNPKICMGTRPLSSGSIILGWMTKTRMKWSKFEVLSIATLKSAGFDTHQPTTNNPIRLSHSTSLMISANSLIIAIKQGSLRNIKTIWQIPKVTLLLKRVFSLKLQPELWKPKTLILDASCSPTKCPKQNYPLNSKCLQDGGDH